MSVLLTILPVSMWGPATPYILAAYGITALGVAALVGLSLRDARRWASRARALERDAEAARARQSAE